MRTRKKQEAVRIVQRGPTHYAIYHWRKFVNLASTLERAHELAEEKRHSLWFAKLEREEKRRAARSRGADLPMRPQWNFERAIV